MNTVCLIVLVPFGIGLLANLTYDLLRNRREYLKAEYRHLTGTYKLYWYNSKHIRDQSDRKISRATIVVKRDTVYRLNMHFQQDDLGDGQFEGYEYTGLLKARGSQIHWTMYGVNHAETCYAIFDRPLGKTIDALPGLFLLTANDRLKKPMAIRCVLCAESVPEDDAKVLLGAKDFLTVKT